MATFVGEDNAMLGFLAAVFGQSPAPQPSAMADDDGSDSGERPAAVKPAGKKAKAARVYNYGVRPLDDDRPTRTHDAEYQRCGGGRRVIRKKPGN